MSDRCRICLSLATYNLPLRKDFLLCDGCKKRLDANTEIEMDEAVELTQSITVLTEGKQ